MSNATDVVNKLRERQSVMERRGRYSEADTVNNLIDPVLEYLGYDAPYQIREIQDSHSLTGHRSGVEFVSGEATRDRAVLLLYLRLVALVVDRLLRLWMLR